MGIKPGANTRLTLFNATGTTQLAQNDNISGTNLFSKFSFSFVSGTTYLIRVENMSPGANVYYRLAIGEMPITGADYLCSSSSYSIQNFPPGATVSWSASPISRVSFSPPNANPTTITRLTDGFVTITANVVSSGCIMPSVVKQVYAGKPLTSGIYTSDGNQQALKLWLGNPATDYNNACNLQTTGTNMQISGATAATWTRTAANPTNTNWSQSGNNVNFYFWAVGQTAVFRLQASNVCGSVVNSYGFKSISCGGGGGGGCGSRYRVSPNPSNGYAAVTVINIPPPCDVKTITQAEQDALTIKTIRVYDNKGVTKKTVKVNAAKKYELLLSDFKNGVYYIEISDGVYIEKQQLIIAK
jgi:hypothetical protein